MESSANQIFTMFYNSTNKTHIIITTSINQTHHMQVMDTINLGDLKKQIDKLNITYKGDLITSSPLRVIEKECQHIITYSYLTVITVLLLLLIILNFLIFIWRIYSIFPSKTYKQNHRVLNNNKKNKMITNTNIGQHAREAISAYIHPMNKKTKKQELIQFSNC
ncbi:unnamed protein product [Rotaria magnacalcarata]|uniref:Uncharacterized protein n=1 Tax=Rotaria magnacalcarata TaxID=392030 RepID=A0A815U7Y1_9BILA|nr:unnamed protein product [Rotaria magnacalcarata]CAF1520491.1 unnamed protein product [Rotaria magnacalcarata]CAF2046913.1 unnamed protein product [Rotaria magnacalcarata]CAF3756420.1 unnamed protein product [Rotaria magnacalcarata]CAF3810041.1 unnamed protein product [Rotaria magnacalcarata]